jgi:uncharacterized protein YjbI with pentapeptide repeats
MAKKKKTQRNQKLAGKKLAFVGRFFTLAAFQAWATEAGGSVVSADESPDYVVAGEGRGGNPPAEVAKIQKRVPSVVVLESKDFVRMVLPSREELIAALKASRRDDTSWEQLRQKCLHAASSPDLSGADLRKADLNAVHLEWVKLDGADLSGAKTRSTQFGPLVGAKLDEIAGPNVLLRNLEGCSFRRANLKEAWLFYHDADTVARCDFTAANLTEAHAMHGRFADCIFKDAKLSDAHLGESVFEGADFSGADLTRLHAEEAKFEGANFRKAKLFQADLRGASLVNADLCQADLREAILSGANLTGANIDGADFAGAVLTGLKVAGVDVSKAKNFQAPTMRKTGPKVKELAAAAAGSKEFETIAQIELGKGHFAQLELRAGVRNGRHWISAVSRDVRRGNESVDSIAAPSFEKGMLNLAERWPKATLRLDSIKVKGSRTVRGQKLQDLATAAWAEVLGVSAGSPEDLQRLQQEQQAAALRERDELMKKIRKKGTSAWDDLDPRARARFDLRGIDLSGGELKLLDMRCKEMQKSNFAGATLTYASLYGSRLNESNFSGATLQGANLNGCDLSGADFRNADLTNAHFNSTHLQGADFTGATLSGTSLKDAQFDQATKFPAGFNPPEEMIWKGTGKRPGLVGRPQPGSLDFDAFMKKLEEKAEFGRLEKALAMLKAERFQLFSEVKDDSVVGVVRSQTNPDLVYSCRLCSDGKFGCCTQNLRPCGGLQGALCKHLLVLIVGLSKSGKLDPATVASWINASRAVKPSLDKEEMTATFLRYKGAEAGEVDWRPTETIPEDYYSL